jgi:hypothetical protein
MADWQMQSSAEPAAVYTADTARDDEYKMRVVPHQDPAYHCDYHFTTALEMFDKTSAAVTHTLESLNSTAPKPSHESESTQ